MTASCSDSGYGAQAQSVAVMENDTNLGVRYLGDNMENWLQTALNTAGMTQAQLAREMTRILGRSIDRAAVNKLAKETRRMQADELMAIIRLTGAEPPPGLTILPVEKSTTTATPVDGVAGPVPLSTAHPYYGGVVRAGEFLPVDD